MPMLKPTNSESKTISKKLTSSQGLRDKVRVFMESERRKMPVLPTNSTPIYRPALPVVVSSSRVIKASSTE